MSNLKNTQTNLRLLVSVALVLGFNSMSLGSHVVHGEFTSQPPTVSHTVLKDFFTSKLISGNIGDFYLNLDNGHSLLNLKNYPQMGKALSENLLSSGEEYSRYKHVIIGNASLGTTTDSRGARVRGSLINNYYTPSSSSEHRIDKLHSNYRKNIILMFPAVGCYGPGINGLPGYGDYFPANTPYVLGSVGASGTDKPFLRAWAHALASFQPLVKAKLKEEGLLMPTIQMIFRMSNSNLLHPDEYLTGKAHPPAFYGGNLDILKMGRLAAAMTIDVLPPMAQLNVLGEKNPQLGIEFFDPRFNSDKIFDSPAAIARTFRSNSHVKKIVVSAEYSYDVNDLPLSYHWVVLRGDEEKIKIIPKNERQSVVEIQVPYFRKYQDPDYPVYLNRVEIGLFVSNGVHHSVPAFITFTSFANEARTYDNSGRIVEIGYNIGDTHIGYADITKRPDRRILSSRYAIKDWQALFRTVLNEDPARLGPRLLRSVLDKAHYQAIASCAAEITECFYRIENCEEEDPALKKTAISQAKLDAYASLMKKVVNDDVSVKELLENALNTLKNDVTLFIDNQMEINKLVEEVDNKKGRSQFFTLCQKLTKLGILRNNGRDIFRIESVRRGTSSIEERLTEFERNQLEWLNLRIMKSFLYPQFMNKIFRINATDVRLSTPKSWLRDVYHYDQKNRLTGWSRYDKNGITEYNANGHLAKGKTISYKVEYTTLSKKKKWYDLQVIPISSK